MLPYNRTPAHVKINYTNRIFLMRRKKIYESYFPDEQQSKLKNNKAISKIELFVKTKYVSLGISILYQVNYR